LFVRQSWAVSCQNSARTMTFSLPPE
jgi:hypothetical protein